MQQPEGRHEFLHARFAQGFIGREPANIQIECPQPIGTKDFRPYT